MRSLWLLPVVSVLLSAHLTISAATCPADGALATKALKYNVWAPLTRSETKKVQDWMYKQKEFNLTRMENATMKCVSYCPSQDVLRTRY